MKKELINKVINKIEQELLSLKEASKATRGYSQSDDLKSESKYDTRAIEAKYLAEAQEARVKLIEQELEILKRFEFKSKEKVITGSVVFCESFIYFIVPISGQGSFIINNEKVSVISYKTLVAQEILGLELDDTFEHPVSGKELHITKIL